MKVNDAGVPNGQAIKAPDGKRSNSSSFSKVLEQKSGPPQQGSRKELEDDPLATPDGAALFPPPIVFPDQNQTGTISQASSAERKEATSIEGLAHEIAVVSQPAGQESVEIQFNSKTLNGLHVQISRQDDQISLRFSTATPAVSELLSRNLDQLSEALHSKGLQVAPIQVELISSPSDSEPSNNTSRDRSREEQNQERRQQRQR